MTHVINPDECILCGACEAECPYEAISEKDGSMWIDPAICQDAGDCVDVCPVDAISPA